MTEQPEDRQPSQDEAAAQGNSEAQGRALAEDLSAQLAKMRGEQEDLMSQLLRLSADYANYQKRVQRDVVEAREYANAALIKDLLMVLDDLDRGLALARKDRPEDDPLRTGMELVQNKAMEVLGRYGLTPIEAVGKGFDPEQHLALMQEVSEEVPPMTVLRELQRGYRLKGRTLRPAAVVVSQALPGADEDP